MTVSKRLFDLLDKRGVSQKELAAGTGISSKTISDWKVKGTSPQSDKIPVLCEFLSVSADWLLTGRESVAEALSAEAVRFASRWSALDDDGRCVVGTAIIQEERRMAEDKKEKAPASSDAKAI